MNYIANKDFLEVKGASIISNVDFDVVSRLYQPLIGYKASMLYFTLVNYVNYNEDELLNHEHIFKLMQILPGDFLLARKALEAVGLLKTYLKIDNEIKHYTYVIHAPKSPKDFFADILFKGLLVRYIGKDEATKLALHYQVNLNLYQAKDISANFMEVFQPNLDDASFDEKMPKNLKDTKAIKVDTNFSFEDFFNHLKTALMINENAFSKDECDEIERIATLYGLDVITMCDIVAQSYDEHKTWGKRVNFNALLKRAVNQAKFSQIARKNDTNKTMIRIAGKTALADEIRLMEELSPKLFLQQKQDGAPPVTADLNLLNYLNDYMGLNRGTINAIINYCLNACNNRLTRSYVEKIAASVKRAKINTALDAINYLENSFDKPHQNKSTKKENTINNEKVKEDESFNEDEYDELIANLHEDK